MHSPPRTPATPPRGPHPMLPVHPTKPEHPESSPSRPQSTNPKSLHAPHEVPKFYNPRCAQVSQLPKQSPLLPHPFLPTDPTPPLPGLAMAGSKADVTQP